MTIVEYTVDGTAAQSELVAAFAEIQERWVRFHPGYRSARFHVSTDGTRVYRNFVETSDTEGRMAAIRQALEGLSAKAEARMNGIPTYTVVREVGPGPQWLDA